MKKRFLLSSGVSGLAVILAADPAFSPGAQAADFTIANGQTVGPQTLTDPGDQGVIEAGGMVSTSGVSSNGVVMLANNQTMNNHGTISGTSGGNIGIASGGANARITNSGTISMTGTALGLGIFSGGANATIINSGTIRTSEVGVHGIDSQGVNGQVINAGRIISQQSNAIQFVGAHDNKLTILPGSQIQGGLVLGGGTDTLVVDRRLSTSLTFDKVPEVIDTQGAPFVVSGTTVTTTGIDSGNLATQDEQLTDLTGGVSTLLNTRLSNLRNNFNRSAPSGRGGAGGRYQTASLEAFSYASNDNNAADEQAETTPFWVQAFGFYRHQGAEGNRPETQQWQSGVLAGMDRQLGDGALAGAFVGFASGGGEVVEGTQESETRGWFTGLYGSVEQSGLILDLSVSGGYSHFEQQREVANNMVAGGIEKADADYGGWFIAPEVMVTAPVEFEGRVLEPALSLGYAGLFLEDYTETDTSAPLSVEGRDLHVGIGRLQLSTPDAFTLENGDILRTRITAGAELRHSFGNDRIEGTLQGQAIRFDNDEDDTTLGGYAGLALEYDAGRGQVFYINGEGLIETESAYQIFGQAGIKFRL